MFKDEAAVPTGKCEAPGPGLIVPGQVTGVTCSLGKGQKEERPVKADVKLTSLGDFPCNVSKSGEQAGPGLHRSRPVPVACSSAPSSRFLGRRKLLYSCAILVAHSVSFEALTATWGLRTQHHEPLLFRQLLGRWFPFQEPSEPDVPVMPA